MKKLLILALLVGGVNLSEATHHKTRHCPKGQVRHCFNLKAPAMGEFCGCAKQKKAIKIKQLQPVSVVQEPGLQM
jgi:hypothetical protein